MSTVNSSGGSSAAAWANVACALPVVRRTSRRRFLHVEQFVPKPRNGTLTHLLTRHVQPFRQPPRALESDGQRPASPL
jgi:hypothetical protein